MESITHAEDKRMCYEPRQWQRVFRALWSSAPRSHDHHQQRAADGPEAQSSNPTSTRTLRVPGRELRIPDTILFEHGEPHKWVGCSPEGEVVRKAFISSASGSGEVDGSTDPVNRTSAYQGASRSSETQHQSITGNTTEWGSSLLSSTGGVENLEVTERLNAVRAAFLSFSSQTSPAIPSDAPVCVARYDDGSTELLSAKSLDVLLGFRDWRCSLSGLQAYIRPSKTITGKYVRCNEGQEDTYRQRQQNTATWKKNTLSTGPETLDGPGAMTSERKRGRNDSPSVFSSGISSTRSEGSTEEPTAPVYTGQVQPAALVDQLTRDVAYLVEMSYTWRGLESPRSDHTTTTATGSDQRVAGCQRNLPRDDKDEPSLSDRTTAMGYGRYDGHGIGRQTNTPGDDKNGTHRSNHAVTGSDRQIIQRQRRNTLRDDKRKASYMADYKDDSTDVVSNRSTTSDTEYSKSETSGIVDDMSKTNIPGDHTNAASDTLFVGEQTRSRRLPWPRSRILISRLEAEFVIDRSGCAWFTNPTQVLLQPARKQPKHSNSSSGSESQARGHPKHSNSNGSEGQSSHWKQKRLKREEIVLEASIAARELRGLICLARRRGLNADEAFRHFKVEGDKGRAGKREVLKGMSSLGFTLSEEAAAVLVQAVVSSAEASRSNSMLEVQYQGLGRPSDARVISERGDAITSYASAAGSEHVTIPKRAAQLKPLPLPPREYFEADDLWRFAGLRDGASASTTSHRAIYSDNVDIRVGAARHGGGSIFSREPKYRLRAPADGKIRTPSKRRRTSRDGGEWDRGEQVGGREGTANTSTTVDNATVDTATADSATPDNATAVGKATETGKSPCAKRKTPRHNGVTAGNGKPRACPTSRLSGTTANGKNSRSPQRGGGVDRRQNFNSWGGYSAAEDPASIPLQAYFPCENPVAEATNGKDRVLHVDRYSE